MIKESVVGTNYYYEPNSTSVCPTCGRSDNTERLHIGKSSAGWVFSLHIIPRLGICTLKDWQRKWAQGGQIRDEYGEFIPMDEMLKTITERAPGLRRHGDVRHQPGEPTYDLSDYDFS